jgi:predicted RNase H-like nuclease (RuvC/YqgF family)
LPVRQLYAALAAGAEIPELVPVPEVSIKDKVLAPEKITQRQKAIDQNNATVEELRALATRGKGIHPKLLEQQAERYRVASQRAEDAEKQAQEASKRAVSAISKAEAMEDALAELGRRYTAKMAQFEALDRDIDRLREMRDREARLGNNQPG